MKREDRYLEAKGLSFGYAAVCLAAVLTISTIGGDRLSLLCFSVGMPCALLAGMLYHINRANSTQTPLQSWILKGSDWFSLSATFMGIAFLLWYKSRVCGIAFIFAVIASVIALFAFIAAKTTDQKPASAGAAGGQPQ